MLAINKNKYYSQFKEDRILDEIFFHQTDGHCVEVGGHDGISGSTTYYFEKKGWKCLIIEPNPDYFNKILKNRDCIALNCAASSEDGETIFYIAESVESLSTVNLSNKHMELIQKEGGTIRSIKVTKKKLDTILEETKFFDIDFITIDVEGHELEVLKGFNLEKYKPKIVIIEDNSENIDWTIVRYMEDHGYAYFKRTGVNDWFAIASDNKLYNKEQRIEIHRERKRTRMEILLFRRFRIINDLISDNMRQFIKKCIATLYKL